MPRILTDSTRVNQRQVQCSKSYGFLFALLCTMATGEKFMQKTFVRNFGEDWHSALTTLILLMANFCWSSG